MIAWQTTLAPETSSAYTTSFSSVRPYNPGAAATIAWTQNYFTSSSQNWSQSVTFFSQLNSYDDDPGGSYSRRTVRLAALIDSISVIGNNETISVRSVINTTTTETTSAYTYKPTATTTQESTSYQSTTTKTNTETTNTQTQKTTQTATYSATVVSTDSATTAESLLTTTTTGEDTIATPIFATVVMAEPGEVLWCMNTSAATDASGIVAASAVATTATRTTLYPWTQTVEAVAFNNSQTTAGTINQITAAIDYTATTTTTATAGYIDEDSSNYWPQKTSVATVNTETTFATNTSATVRSSSAVTFYGSASVKTMATWTYTTTGHSINGSTFGSSATTRTAISQSYQPASAETWSSTATYTYPIFYAETDITKPYTTAEGTSTGSQTNFLSNAATTFAPHPQGVVASKGQGTRRLEHYVGVVGSDGDIYLGYSCSAALGYNFDLLEKIEREVSSVFPKVAKFSTFSGEDVVEVATVTWSGLSGTLSTLSATTTSTVYFSAIGDPQRTLIGLAESMRFDGISLGRSETAYQTLEEGVYSGETGTFSASRGGQSFVSGQTSSVPAVIALSHVVPDTAMGAPPANPLVWTVSRNTHESLGVITDALAYSRA